ncbi:MAG: hypothetical protein MGF17_09570 [Trichodesmium sp. MAG_R04]|nr:hypothetical protein [Trichodesmium sp. MAG_R04]
MTGFITKLFGKKNDNQSQENFFLDRDSASSLGNVDYMRKSKTVKRSYPKAAGKINYISGETKKSVSSMEKRENVNVAENKTAENKTAENKTAENKTAENKTVENKTPAYPSSFIPSKSTSSSTKSSTSKPTPVKPTKISNNRIDFKSMARSINNNR